MIITVKFSKRNTFSENTGRPNIHVHVKLGNRPIPFLSLNRKRYFLTNL